LTVADLPPGGVDLRVELQTLETSRVVQALAVARGDMATAATLLRLTRLELAHAMARAGVARGMPPPAPSSAAVERAATVRDGLLVISRAAILQLAAEGHDEWTISRRLDVNKYVVEKVLRAETDRSVRRLAGDGFSTREIAAELRLTLKRVALVLETPAAERDLRGEQAPPDGRLRGEQAPGNMKDRGVKRP
jgi:DNA-binding NarL/FixJ family response regulator